jgi:uncharacterized protein (DUF1697 family)
MKYIAFLRAVNVGGTKVIKMDDLKRMFESFGLANVQTFIQSGNVIFEAGEESDLAFRIEAGLEAKLGYKVKVFVRTMDELANIARSPIFEPQRDEVLHIVLLNEPPDKKARQALAAFNSPADEFTIKGREAYNLRRDREASVFSNQFIEKTLKVPATTRNLNTLRKIVEKFG